MVEGRVPHRAFARSDGRYDGLVGLLFVRLRVCSAAERELRPRRRDCRGDRLRPSAGTLLALVMTPVPVLRTKTAKLPTGGSSARRLRADGGAHTDVASRCRR